MEKLIITAAITGSRITREMTPHIPITPEEIVQSAMECWQAGASIVHIHVRDPQTGLGTQSLEIFRQVVEPLQEKTNLILLGGFLHRDSNIFHSAENRALVSNTRADRAFISTGGFDPELGLTTYFYYEADIKREMIRSARAVISSRLTGRTCEA